MRIAVKLIFTGAILALAGCAGLSSLNPFSSKSAPHNLPADLPDVKSSLKIRPVWSNAIGKSGEFVFSPVVAGDSVFVAAADGALARLDVVSGRTVWRIDAGSPLTAGVGSNGETTAVAAEKGMVFAFDAEGKLRWKAQASSEILSAPAVGYGLVIVRSVDNRIVAFDAESGVRRWIVQRTAPALTLRTAPGIVIEGQAAFVALPGGRLLALALNNGAPLWEVAVGDPRGATELERIADTSGAPLFLGREVCAVAYQGRVACFDAATGASHWAKKLSSTVGLAADERAVFAVDEHDAITAFARDGGTSVWRNSNLANRHLSTPVSLGRAVVFGDGQGYLHFLSRDDGALLARTNTDGSPIIAAPIVVGPNVIFQTQSGAVVAFATE